MVLRAAGSLEQTALGSRLIVRGVLQRGMQIIVNTRFVCDLDYVIRISMFVVDVQKINKSLFTIIIFGCPVIS